MFINPDDKALMYSGRIDFDNPLAPVLVYSCSYIKTVFTGKSIKARIRNIRNCYTDSIGVIVDGVAKKVPLFDDREVHEYLLFSELTDGEHEIILYKAMDGGAHYFEFLGFELEEGACVNKPYASVPERRMEVIGDSVSCGEVCEALHRLAESDPEDNDGQYSNSWYSYSWQVARNLGAELHNISQGGIALFDKTGWFNGPEDLRGVVSTYGHLKYNPPLGESDWDYSKWTPQVIVLAIGQNDANPKDIMKDDYDGAAAQIWRAGYKSFIETLQKIYPGVTIICTTTVLMHDLNWDRAIDEVVKKINEESKTKAYHFMYNRTGKATPGHPRIPEHNEMAEELTAFINSLGEDIWVNNN